MDIPLHRSSGPSSLWRVSLWSAAAWCLLPKNAAADGSVTLKHQSYQERDGRIRVDSQYGLVETQLPAEVKMKLVGVIDTLAGATPTGQLDSTQDDPVVYSHMEDRRKAWHAEFSRPFGAVTATLGLDNSRESDYVSNSLSLNTATDFNQKNTTFLAGFAAAHDDVRTYNPVGWSRKRTYDALLGVTQLLDPSSSLNFTVTYGKSTGFLSDPYKLVAQQFEVFPGVFVPATYSEHRPDRREKWTGLVAYNRAFAEWNGAFDGSYRYFRDTFGVQAHTVALQWFQKFWHDRLIVIPSVRYHRQGAASFYYATLDGTGLTPTASPADATSAYSSDYRLSKLDTVNLGLKLVWTVVPDRVTVDAAYDRYRMIGRDDATPGSAYPTANLYTVGVKYAW